jgi:hypothetical protein
MAELNEMIQVKTQSGQPVTVNGVTITPQSQAFTIRWPYGGFVWNRPVAVMVERDGQSERIPIVDVTLVGRMALFGFGLFLSVVTLVLCARKRRI